MTFDSSSTLSFPPGPTASCEEALRDGVAVVEPELRRVIDTLHRDVARVCRYHLGWRPEPSAAAGGGKRVRAALSVLSARAAGAGDDIAAAAGTAVELVHQFTLLHDDVMDGDEERRGRPAAWVAFGTGPAVLAGDALLVQAIATITRTAAPGASQALEHLLSALSETVRGQAEDLALERVTAHHVPVERYYRMVDGKTGALLGCAAGLGALLAGRTGQAAELHRAGLCLGRAFQAADDLLGLWGETAVTGKPIGCDLLRGKKTLPVLLGIRSGTAAGERAAALLEEKDLSARSVARVIGLLEEAGARTATEDAVAAHTGRAVAALDRSGLPVAQRPLWDGLLATLSGRDR